jgi:hypothetical protein
MRAMIPMSLGAILLCCCMEPLCLDRAIHAQEPAWSLPEGVEFSSQTKTEPRPLAIYSLSIDLTKKSYEFAVVPGPDPDGDGPIEATLTPPAELGNQSSAIALINTSAWGMFPDKETGKPQKYVAGGQADILGWVANRDRKISPSQSGFWTCWMDNSGRASIINPDSKEESPGNSPPLWAVSGFRGILVDGEILPEPSQVRHPRTALGLSADGTRMLWLVVDGRQPGYSEGVSEQELAQLMIDAGCDDAMNLDGGGSSIMLLRDSKYELTAANRPSDRTGPRPIPVALCLRRTEQSN